ncbi:MAG: diguanylate cyclase, partial [Myxococcales bacterium]
AIAERIRVAVASRPVRAGDRHVAYTVSMGVATWSEPAEALEHLLARADRALYAAKHGGRNQVRRALAA